MSEAVIRCILSALQLESIFSDNSIMKTTIDIPDKELRDAMRYTSAKTKRDAVVQALRDFNRRQRLAELATMLGTFRDFMTQEDLQQMREDNKWQDKD
jgi:Arc/MetJ family transcription regulator